ncbi:hypothetical protein ASZ90_006224 [hydrocarbon metagenome]|uniref:Fibronectin type-III domain-containing protein n=1 Tax=hydrocarbon metagenome TaxID=938273 RepID=A0A0W8FSU6_9ZZZZ
MKKLSAYLLLLSLVVILISACGSKTDTPAAVTPSPPDVSTIQLRADAGDKQATLYWPMVAGADTYNVYYSTSYSFTKSTGILFATGLPSAPSTVTGLNNGTTYYFAFTAVSATNGESDLSDIAPAIPTAPPPPTAPKNVRANAGNAEITVTWTPVTAVPAVASYNIRLECTAPTDYAKGVLTVLGQSTSSETINSGSGITWIIKPVTWGPENDRLCAVNMTAETAETGPSGKVSATLGTESTDIDDTTGAVVTSITAKSYIEPNQHVSISWVDLPGTHPYTSYNLYYYPDSSPGTVTRIPEFRNGNSVSGLENGIPYTFYLQSTVASSPSFAVLVTPTETPPPMAPVLEPPELTGSTVTLTWNEVAATPEVTHYYVYVGTAQGVSKETGAPSLVSDIEPPLTTEATLPTGTYYIVVTAVNENGESTESNEVSVTVP